MCQGNLPTSYFFACLLLLTALQSPGFVFAQNATSPEVSEEALAAITSTIADVQAEISRRSSERSSVYRALQDTEKNLANIEADIRETENNIADNKTQLAQFIARSGQLELQKQQQQELIAQYIRSAYQTGRQEYFKLLLNQENPALVARTLRYYRYFNTARNDKVEAFNATLAELDTLQTRVSQTTAALHNQREALAERQQALQASVTERQDLLDELDVVLASTSDRLEALEAEKVEMELLVEELRRSIADLALGNQQQPFAALQGNLPWPVEGRIKNNWGSSYGLGDLNWEGVLIDAREDSEVQAIHHGRVVFADWFSSSGLLLIIDHGGGYMSLYAHNKALFKDVGEWVDSGEIIAAVGNTGGQGEYGLYFEIRYNGDSINPTRWCLARN